MSEGGFDKFLAPNAFHLSSIMLSLSVSLLMPLPIYYLLLPLLKNKMKLEFHQGFQSVIHMHGKLLVVKINFNQE